MSASRTRLTRGAFPGMVDVVQKPGGSVSWACGPRCAAEAWLQGTEKGVFPSRAAESGNLSD